MIVNIVAELSQFARFRELTQNHPNRKKVENRNNT